MTRKAPVQKAPERNPYVVQADGWIAGRRRAKGEELQLTESEARYETLIAPKGAKTAAKGDAAK